MVLGANGDVWMDAEEEEEGTVSSWTKNNNNNNNNEVDAAKEEDIAMAAAGSFSTFKSMLETDWLYMNNPINPSHQDLHCQLPFSSTLQDNLLLHQPVDSSSSCSPSQAFTLDPSQSVSHPLFPSKSCFSSLLNIVCNNPFEGTFDMGFEGPFLSQFQPHNQPSSLMNVAGQIFPPELSSSSEFAGFCATGFEGLDVNRGKMLKPLEVFAPMGAQPTLFQKRAAAFRQSGEKLGALEILKRRRSEEEEIEEGSFDVSGLNYDDSEENDNVSGKVEESVRNGGGSNSNANSKVTGGGGGGGDGDQKGKKKGMPAKNLMAERRRRKKLNDRLYMLRSVVPKISKV